MMEVTSTAQVFSALTPMISPFACQLRWTPPPVLQESALKTRCGKKGELSCGKKKSSPITACGTLTLSKFDWVSKCDGRKKTKNVLVSFCLNRQPRARDRTRTLLNRNAHVAYFETTYLSWLPYCKFELMKKSILQVLSASSQLPISD